MSEETIERQFPTVGDGSGQEHSDHFYREELQLATRNRGMPLEALRHPITPTGLHYLLIHYDIPMVDASTWTLEVGGLVSKPLRLTLDEMKERPAETIAVTMECAGNGRALLSPRRISQPWRLEAIGTAQWTGVPLRLILEEAGVTEEANEILFTGLDRGIDGGELQHFQRSLSVSQASRDEVILAYEMNGEPLPPQHGFPLRLIVPGWYGMASVKWLDSIDAIQGPFQGHQMVNSYRYRQEKGDPGEPVTEIRIRALMIPPGIPDFLTRTRLVESGEVTLTGRAWAGRRGVSQVEVSTDAGDSWSKAQLGEELSPYAWRAWEFDWSARPGRHTLCVRATDSEGNVQPQDQPWNLGGYGNNMIQRLDVVVE